jgi:hypothetical protein
MQLRHPLDVLLTALFWVFGVTAYGLDIAGWHITVLAGRCLIARCKMRGVDLTRLFK